MRRLVPCLIVTLLALTACDKKKTAPTEGVARVAPMQVGTATVADPVVVVAGRAG
jgi:hypothetical protein